MAPLASALAALLLIAAPARAQYDPRCAGWQGTTEPQPLNLCNPIPPAALEYAKQCLAMFRDKLDDRYVVIGNYFGTTGEFSRLYVLKWDAADPSKSTILLRGGLGQGAGNGTVDGRPTGAVKDARDQWDSNSSPGGCMRLYGSGGAGVMPSWPQYRGFKVDGLEQRNSCVLTRGIHFHESEAVYTRRSEPADQYRKTAVPLDQVELGDNLTNGGSHGCFNVSYGDYDWIKKNGIVRGKGTLFLSYDGCQDPIAPRGPARRCQDKRDVLDCKVRAAAPKFIPQMMVDQRKANEKAMKRSMEFYDKIRGGLSSQ